MLYTPTRGCNSARRGARRGRLLRRLLCVGGRIPARWIGDRRRRAPTAHPSARGARGGTGREARGGSGAGAVRRRAASTCLSAASYSAILPKASPYCFGVRLRARGCAASVGCTAQRSFTRRSGRPRRRHTAAARRSRRMRHYTRHSAEACACTADGAGTRPPHSADRRSGNGAPAEALGVHVGIGCDEQSDDSAIAEARRPVQRGEAIAVHGGAGVRGWAPRGYPVLTGTRKQNSTQAPRVDRGFVFG